jgi:hypothetical protein
VIPDGGGSLPNVHIVREELVVQPGEFGAVHAKCPNDEFVTGGGYLVFDSSFEIRSNYPDGQLTWLVDGRNPNTASQVLLNAYAVCIDFSP